MPLASIFVVSLVRQWLVRAPNLCKELRPPRKQTLTHSHAFITRWPGASSGAGGSVAVRSCDRAS